MGNKHAFRYRVEIWEISGKRYYAQIWLEEEWSCLPVEQRPNTAMLVQNLGWVNLRPIEEELPENGKPGEGNQAG